MPEASSPIINISNQLQIERILAPVFALVLLSFVVLGLLGFINLFELPVLFYTLVPLLAFTGLWSDASVARSRDRTPCGCRKRPLGRNWHAPLAHDKGICSSG